MRYKNKEYVHDEDVQKLSENHTEEEVAAYNKNYDEATKVTCLMLATMYSELQKDFKIGMHMT